LTRYSKYKSILKYKITHTHIENTKITKIGDIQYIQRSNGTKQRLLKLTAPIYNILRHKILIIRITLSLKHN